MHTAYEEILDFITTGPSLQSIVDFQLSEDTMFRVAYLLKREDAGLASEEETEELREFTRADHFMQQLKVRARRRLGLPEEEGW
ncbi:MAG: hypothetical protein KC519_02115 [Anaerolineae bacterium]|nr:hypothetical protein [Anaerolineae bacterium]